MVRSSHIYVHVLHSFVQCAIHQRRNSHVITQLIYNRKYIPNIYKSKGGNSWCYLWYPNNIDIPSIVQFDSRLYVVTTMIFYSISNTKVTIHITVFYCNNVVLLFTWLRVVIQHNVIYFMTLFEKCVATPNQTIFYTKRAR